MKFAWRGKITDIASSNCEEVEIVGLEEFRELHEYGVREYELEIAEDQFVIDDCT
jgi:hypothetical protein